MRRKIFLLVFLIFLMSLFSFGKDFYIKKLHIELTVNKNSTISVKENITVHFFKKRHGIVREIPYEYRVIGSYFSKTKLQRGSSHKILIKGIKVKNFPFKVRKRRGYVFIRIGDPNKFVYGDTNYQIEYTVYGGLNEFEDHYELYWNLLGAEWGVRVENFAFRVNLPEGAVLSNDKILIFSGTFGERGNSLNVGYEILDNSFYMKHPVYVPENNYITAVLWIEKGAVSTPLSLKLKIFLMNHPAIPLPFLIFPLLYFLWYKIGKDEKFTTMVYYKPPEGMHPAEAGILIDDVLDNRDLISIIINWAVNGIVKIKELNGGKDYEIIKLKPLPDNSKEYEKVFYNELFNYGDSVKISSLKNKFYKTMSKIKILLNEDIKEANYYTKGSRTIGALLIFLGIITFFLSFFMLFNYGIYDFIAMGISGGLFFLFGKIMPQKTEKGTEKYKILKGFKEFIEKVEKPVLEKMLEEDPMFFDRFLPYAIVMGVEKKWAEKFKDLIKEPPKWYEGDYGRGFSTVYFVSHLNSAVSNINSSFTSSPSGSGASSGGGFSGGGFGGGGGNSW